MQFTQESKSQLAKLMATENITIEHRKVKTASFHLKDRVLWVPIWKNMTGELYDLLLGHEVGHALETPEEGWHDAVVGTGKFHRNFKNFLNVVEDARIEKKIKRRYPGLRQSFIKGYNQLIEKDFFGLSGRNINDMSFIDRLNLYTKSAATNNIQFNDEELEMVNQVEDCETWQDVLDVTEAIFEYSKQEQKERIIEKLSNSPYDTSGNDSEDEDEKNFSESYNEDGGDSIENFEDFKPFPNDGKPEDETYEEIEEYHYNRYKDSVESQEDFVPVCETDKNFRNNEEQLLSEENFDYVYLNLPKPIYSEILTHSDIVHDKMEEDWTNNFSKELFHKNREELYNDFRKKNEKYISLLAKEFEMQKAASKFSKQKISGTGDIDVSKIYKYQVDDNIFRKMTKVPKGKSHGLMMVFDRSGSMRENMTGTIEQMLVLSLFCRKVNIPFSVYGFGNSTKGFFSDHKRPSNNSFGKEPNQLYLPDVYLRSYLNSEMSSSMFNRAVKNLICLANSYHPNSADRRFLNPSSESLSNTPLNETLVALRDLTLKFKKENNLDIVKTVILHDGDADRIYTYINGESKLSVLFETKMNCFLNDKEHKFQMKVNISDIRESLMKWYSATTGSSITGFFITPKKSNLKSCFADKYFFEGGISVADKVKGNDNIYSYETNYRVKETCKELIKKMKEEKFIESYNKGYSKFFMIPSGYDIQIENDEMEIEGNITQNKLRNAFIKMNKKKQVNRVLVNRFIGEIAV